MLFFGWFPGRNNPARKPFKEGFAEKIRKTGMLWVKM